MVKDSAHATCVILDLCKKSDLIIHHILEKHWKELHLPKIGAADSFTMLSNLQIEVLPKFNGTFLTPTDCYCAL